MDPLTIAMTVLAALLVVGILLQQRGAGIGGALGGGSDASFSTRRGSEKTIFNGTVIVAILFFAVAIARLLF